MAQRLDLPDTEPLGANWSPVTSGFPSRDKYVLARTFSDPTVGRSGMVISHALICDLAEIVGVNDLRPLLTHLITSAAAAPDAVEPLDVSPGQDMPPASPTWPTPRRRSSPAGTARWCGSGLPGSKSSSSRCGDGSGRRCAASSTSG
ncbi:hypothetical protein ACFSUK_25815 [Sphingobium scionense]